MSHLDVNKPMEFDLKKGLSWGAVIEIRPNCHPFYVTVWHAKSKNNSSSIELIQNIRNELLVRIVDKDGTIYTSRPVDPELFILKSIYFGFSVQFLENKSLHIKTFVNAKLQTDEVLQGNFAPKIKNALVRIGSNVDDTQKSASFCIGELFIYGRADDILIDERIWKYIDEKWSVSKGISSKEVNNGSTS